MPLLDNVSGADYLGLELGARYSDYKYAGGVRTWKLGSAWQPIDAMRFSVMYQRSVQAPNNQELPESEVGIFEADIGYHADYIFGGNPILRPEEGETLTVRWQITPPSMPDWNFSIDYFEMEIVDAIGEIEVDLVCFDLHGRRSERDRDPGQGRCQIHLFVWAFECTDDDALDRRDRKLRTHFLPTARLC